MLFLVRHGRTDANAKGLLQGRLDLPLDAIGRRQAAAVAKMIGDVDEVISSSLVRATETAAYFGRDVEIDDRWIELAYGEYEGVPTGEVPPEVWQSWKTNALFATKGGEQTFTHSLEKYDKVQKAAQAAMAVGTMRTRLKAGLLFFLQFPLV